MQAKNNLTLFVSEEIAVQLNYPNPTPAGNPVIIHHPPSNTSTRAHLISANSEEVYFEVSRYNSHSLQDALTRFQEELLANNPDVILNPTHQTEVKGHPSHQFTAIWPTKGRLITFIQHPHALYRIIYNPRSPLNKQILASLTFTTSYQPPATSPQSPKESP